jgi:XTP/dITP diphosphohydrolase
MGPQDFPPEGEDSYLDNAILKAQAGARCSGLVCLGEDSGLEVDALGGAPGPASAVFLGREASYQERFRYILGRLEGLPDARRTARFRCLMAVAEPDTGRTWTVEGVCEGLIAREPRGTGGFGYDPIFYLPSLMATMAELPPHQKNIVSHRARAAWQVRQVLKELLYERSRR